jgi:hypothetical protein
MSMQRKAAPAVDTRDTAAAERPVEGAVLTTLCLKPFIMDCDMRGFARQAKRMSSAQSRGVRCSAAGASSVKGLGLR